MPYKLKGTLKAPNGTPLIGVDIKFIAQQTFSPLLQQVDAVIRTTQAGGYDLSLEFNTYTVMATVNNCGQVCMGAISVFADTTAGQDLPTLLQKTDWQPATPDYIKRIEEWLAESNRLNNQAIASAAAAKASEIAVEADRAEVASNKTIVLNAQADVTNKQAQVSASAAAAASSASSASASAATASQKEALATSAANTASQKASLAAGSEASANDSARRAEEAAQAVSSALIDGGSANLSGGSYPPPVSVSGVKRSTFWKVTVGGTVSGVDYGAGDTLIYTTTGGGSYYKIDNTESVSKVNEKTGVVVLSAADVGAEDRGTAAALVTQHATKTGAHPISGVSGLQTELDSKYSPSNKPTAADVGALPITGGILDGNTFVNTGNTGESQIGVKRSDRAMYLYDNNSSTGLHSIISGKADAAIVSREVSTGAISVGSGSCPLTLDSSSDIVSNRKLIIRAPDEGVRVESPANAACYIRGTVGGVNRWFVGNGSVGSDTSVSFQNYTNQSSIILRENDIFLSSPNNARYLLYSVGFRPETDNNRSLGQGNSRWSVVYAATGAINTSDAREKTPVEGFTPAEARAAIQLSKEIGTFKWLESMKEKGTEARTHIGLTVQRVIEIMEQNGLEPFKYGFICYDKWEADEEAGTEAGDRYALRMDQLNLFIVRGFEERLKIIESAITL